MTAPKRDVKVTAYFSRRLYDAVTDYAALTRDAVSCVICDAVSEKMRRETTRIKGYREAMKKVEEL